MGVAAETLELAIDAAHKAHPGIEIHAAQNLGDIDYVQADPVGDPA